MDARAKTVREIQHSGDQYLIPFFQRYYSWKHRHWERLRADVWALMEDPDANSQHFLGPLVCTPTAHVPGEVPAYQLIDGQQRLTTLTILLAALRDVASEQGFDDLAEEITEDYLVHKRKKALQRYKVVPRIGDREALIGVVEGKIESQHRQFSVYRAWQFFRKRITEWTVEDAEASLRKLFVVLTERLSLVVITIDGENPYEIFESLNSTGLPLEESDLSRNYIFMQVSTSEQEEFNKAHWESLESMFEESGSFPEIAPTLFYRSFLMHEGTYSKAKMTFVDFKDLNRRRGIMPADQVAELRRFLRYEQLLRRPDTCDDDALRRALRQIGLLEITTAHPLLMNLLDRHESNGIDDTTLFGCLEDLCSFVLRRSICGESTRNYGRWFVEAIAAIKDDPREDLRRYWIRRGWPDDAAFVPRLKEFPLYRRESRKCRLVLLALEESYGHKEKVNPSTLSIEHVMPQTIKSGKSGKAWQVMLGDRWKADHEAHLHTIGNLTLTGYNPDLSNKPFPEKQAELVNSNLILNKVFENVETWNADTINERGQKLAAEVAKLWARPEVGEYVPPVETGSDKLSPAERRQLRLDYWTDLLSVVEERGVPSHRPKPPGRGWIGFPIGIRGFRVLAFINLNKRYIGVALACRGSNAEENFALLRKQKSTIESEIGENLLWQELPRQKSSRITLRWNGVSPAKRDDWTEQHAWLTERLETFHDVFVEHCKAISPAEPEGDTPQGLRKRFWTGLLERASGRTDLHSSISPGKYHWIGTAAGTRGLGYNYVIVSDAGSVELYIDRGKGNKGENKRIFDMLHEKKDQVETVFGGELDWQRLDSKRACRITWHLESGGYRSDESEWPQLQDEMIDAMIRLKNSLSPCIPEVKAALSSSD